MTRPPTWRAANWSAWARYAALSGVPGPAPDRWLPNYNLYYSWICWVIVQHSFDPARSPVAAGGRGRLLLGAVYDGTITTLFVCARQEPNCVAHGNGSPLDSRRSLGVSPARCSAVRLFPDINLT